ncbi:MAG: VOC family protein [Gammaproteobacteria bacterium]|nr:VOC family protein [Gammaproteobacteria bacterium]MDH5802555.1 VOC family protein [Gammaproteobacteria bacterium]
MKLELDHFFILVKPGAQVADRLINLGMHEGSPNRHPGQGTANRRFFFPGGGALELLYICDEQEALNGPGRDLNLVQRSRDPLASPFGIVVRRCDNQYDNHSQALPFAGWSYQPDYFKPPMAFHVGENSPLLQEPLCIYLPFKDPDKTHALEEKMFSREDLETRDEFNTISHITTTCTAVTFSPVLQQLQTAKGISLECGKTHHMEIRFDDFAQKITRDLRPELPLTLCW